MSWTVEDFKSTSLEVGQWCWGTLQGAFNEKQTISQVIVDAVIGMVPLLGDATAVRAAHGVDHRHCADASHSSRSHGRNRGAVGEYPHFVTTGGGEQGSESDLEFRPLPRVTRQSRQQNLHWTKPPLPFDRSPTSRAKNTFRSARAVIRDRIGSPVNRDGLHLRAAPAPPHFGGKPRSAGRQSSSR